MENFETNIQLCNEKLRLIFSRVLCSSGEKYFVKAVGERTYVAFEMKKEGERWRMALPVPDWLLRHEIVVAKLLREREAASDEL